MLYDKTAIVAQNFLVLLSVSSMTSFAIILLLGYYHRLHFNISQFFKNFFPLVFLLIFGIMITKNFIQDHSPVQNFASKLSIEEVLPNVNLGKVYKFGDILPDNTERSKIEDTLDRIYRSHEIYIGYHPGIAPFSYFNSNGELVGYDIAYAYKLAEDMNAKPVFIPIAYDHLANALTNNICDIMISPVLVAEASIRGMNFPHYYLDQPNVLIVLRERKGEFEKLDNLKKNPSLIIGNFGFFGFLSGKQFLNAKSVLIDQISDISQFLKKGQIDALFWAKDQAIAYCRDHPEYIVLEYGETGLGKSYYAFPVKYNAFGFIFFLNRWLELSDSSGFNKEQLEYWMQGHPRGARTPRWSLLREIIQLGESRQ